VAALLCGRGVGEPPHGARTFAAERVFA